MAMSTLRSSMKTTARSRALIFGALLLLAGAGTLAAQGVRHFIAPETYVSNGATDGPSMYWSAAGDFNGDGLTDLAAPDGLVFNNSMGFTVVFGQPGGGFSTPVSRSAGMYVRYVDTADFNHDGCVDLLLTTASGDAVMLGTRGGVFDAPRLVPVRLVPNASAIVDFNGDGHPDVVAAGDLGYAVSLGDGAGAFGQGITFPEPTPSYWVVIGDFNGDGHPDFTGTGGIGGNTYLGNGDGTFQAPIRSGIVPTVGAITADFNQDGVLDMVMMTAQPRQDGSNFSINISMGWGDGTFTGYSNYVFAQPLRGLTVGDFNDDGIPDVATHVTQTGKLRVFAGTGFLTIGGDLIDSPLVSPGALLSADVDGNGSPDLVLSGYRDYMVFRNTHGHPPLLSSVALNPPAVIGGASSTGTVQLGGIAPADGAVVMLASSDATLAAFPNGPTVTIPAGASSATFAIATAQVAGASSVAVTASWGGVTQAAQLDLVPAYTLTGLTIDPSSQYGIFTVTGTVTLSQPADSNATVLLATTDPTLATVPGSVKVPAGATTATFTITLRPVAADATVDIIALRGDVLLTSPVTVMKPRDTVAIAKAQVTQKTSELRIEATSTSAATTITVHNAATGAWLGTLANSGGGKYKGSVFLFVPAGTTPGITLKSALGGTVTGPVAVK
jgi:hypothetical protein